jgi:hypothetical protein
MNAKKKKIQFYLKVKEKNEKRQIYTKRLHLLNKHHIKIRETTAIRGNIKSLNIPNFDVKCRTPIERCDHSEHKYWGSLYSPGIKCKKCGVEGESQLDEYQMLETNSSLGMAVRWHRISDGYYRCPDSVEHER